MDKKIMFKFVIKVLLYALTLIASYLGVSSLTSCTSYRSVDSVGCTRIVVSDTTIVSHQGSYNLKFK
jgi:CHASE3 domain sensor protein